MAVGIFQAFFSLLAQLAIALVETNEVMEKW